VPYENDIPQLLNQSLLQEETALEQTIQLCFSLMRHTHLYNLAFGCIKPTWKVCLHIEYRILCISAVTLWCCLALQVRYSTPPNNSKKPTSLRSRLNALLHPHRKDPSPAEKQRLSGRGEPHEGGHAPNPAKGASAKEPQVLVLKRVQASRGWEVKQSGVREGYFGRLLKQEQLQLCCRLLQHAGYPLNLTQRSFVELKELKELKELPASHCPYLKTVERGAYETALQQCVTTLRAAEMPGEACPSLTGAKAGAAAAAGGDVPPAAAGGSSAAASGTSTSPTTTAATTDGGSGSGASTAAATEGGSVSGASTAAASDGGGSGGEGQSCDEELLIWLPGVVLGHQHLVQFEEGFEMPCSGDVWLVFQVGVLAAWASISIFDRLSSMC
jgi:hypothetical protein